MNSDQLCVLRGAKWPGKNKHYLVKMAGGFPCYALGQLFLDPKQTFPWQTHREYCANEAPYDRQGFLGICSCFDILLVRYKCNELIWDSIENTSQEEYPKQPIKEEEIELVKKNIIEDTLINITKGRFVEEVSGLGPEDIKAILPKGKSEIILVYGKDGEEQTPVTHQLAGYPVENIKLVVDKGILTLEVKYEFEKIVAAQGGTK